MTIRKTAVRILYKDNIQDRCLSIRVKNLEDDLSQKDITSCIYTVNDNTSENGETRNILSVKEILDEDDSNKKRLVKVGLYHQLHTKHFHIVFYNTFTNLNMKCRCARSTRM